MRSRAVPFASLFRNDPDSVVTLRLLATANDLRSAVRLMKGAIEASEHPGHAGRSRANGEMLYAFRMAAVHAFEAYQVLNPGKEVRDFFETRRGKLGDSIADRYRVLLRQFAADDLQGILSRVRNAAGAHYFRDVFTAALEANTRVEPSLVTFHETNALEQHFEAADEVYWRVLAGELAKLLPDKPTMETLGLAMRRIGEVQIGLTELASLMLVSLYEERIDGA